MKIDSNPHTHTTFCDGKDTPEEMVVAALDAGFTTLGFSGHSPTPCDPGDFSGVADLPGYIREVRRLEEKYRDRIGIRLGLEMDYYFQVPWEDFDYVIGAVHYIRDETRGLYFPVDANPEPFETCIEEVFGGDGMAMVRHYYDLVVQMARLKPDILAHFDLITKLNRGQQYFDENSLEYKKIALEALEEAAKTGCIFEINSGGMYRGFTHYPYPAEFLLRRLLELDASVILSSDTHCRESIDFYFDEMLSIVRDLGFEQIILLGEEGFYKKALFPLLD